MAVYTKDSKLCGPVFEDPSIVAVINRFGIYLGVGDNTICESCMSAGIDTDFFLAVINTYLNTDYFPEKIVEQTHLSLVLDYLEQTDLYYSRIQLPNIDRHFNLLMRKDDDKHPLSCGNLHLLNKFYHEVKDELQYFIANDCNYWFPMLRERNEEAIRLISEGYGISEGKQIELPFNNTSLEDKIRDLISFFVIHLKGNYDHNLCVAVVSAISILERDIRQNNRIRDRILQPLCTK